MLSSVAAGCSNNQARHHVRAMALLDSVTRGWTWRQCSRRQWLSCSAPLRHQAGGASSSTERAAPT